VGLVNDRGANVIEAILEYLTSLREGPVTQIGASLDHDACRFSRRVGINDDDSLQRGRVYATGHDLFLPKSARTLPASGGINLHLNVVFTFLLYSSKSFLIVIDNTTLIILESLRSVFADKTVAA
jgi:hypothetical protein